MNGLRTRQKASRRQQILEAAAKLFHERGYEQTRITTIAEHAEIATGTIYNYFGSKDGVLLELILDQTERVKVERQPLLDDPDDDPVVAVVNLLHAMIDSSSAIGDRTFWCHAYSAWLTSGSEVSTVFRQWDEADCDQIAKLLRTLIERDRLSRKLPADDMAIALFGMANYEWMSHIATRQNTTNRVKQLVARRVDLMLKGWQDTDRRMRRTKKSRGTVS